MIKGRKTLLQDKYLHILVACKCELYEYSITNNKWFADWLQNSYFTQLRPGFT